MYLHLLFMINNNSIVPAGVNTAEQTIQCWCDLQHDITDHRPSWSQGFWNIQPQTVQPVWPSNSQYQTDRYRWAISIPSSYFFFQFHKFLWSQWNASKYAIAIRVSFPITSYFSEFDALCMVMLCSPLQILKKLNILQICWLTSTGLKYKLDICME